MRLTTFTDYSLRLLIYAAARGDRLITIEEAHRVYGISRGHLMKVANHLTREGFLKAVRGRSGGVTLAKHPREIRLGDVVRATEPDFALVECFAAGGQCAIARCCALPGILNEALNVFVSVLDRYTLEELMLHPNRFLSAPMKRLPRRGPPPGLRAGEARRAG